MDSVDRKVVKRIVTDILMTLDVLTVPIEINSYVTPSDSEEGLKVVSDKMLSLASEVSEPES